MKRILLLSSIRFLSFFAPSVLGSSEAVNSNTFYMQHDEYHIAKDGFAFRQYDTGINKYYSLAKNCGEEVYELHVITRGLYDLFQKQRGWMLP